MFSLKLHSQLVIKHLQKEINLFLGIKLTFCELDEMSYSGTISRLILGSDVHRVLLREVYMFPCACVELPVYPGLMRSYVS